jgi:hypothetical protein
MIKDNGGKKVTPKQFAARVVSSNLESANYWSELFTYTDGMTEKEIESINLQIIKLQSRFDKILNKIIYKK